MGTDSLACESHCHFRGGLKEMNVLCGFLDIFALESRSERRGYDSEVLGSCSSYQSSALGLQFRVPGKRLLGMWVPFQGT